MNTFIFDILHDLRAKRLLPVAVVLLVVAMVAVLLALPKSPEEEVQPAPTTAPTAELPTVSLAGETIGGRSRLDVSTRGPPSCRLGDAPGAAGASPSG